MNLRSNRLALGISQSKLARLSGVSRFKICLFELGDSALSGDDQERIRRALQAEAERVRNISVQIDFSRSETASLHGVSR
jgi:predicted transcriptional regulator